VIERPETLEKAFTVQNLEGASALPISSVVLTNQRVAATDALFTVKQKIATDAFNPLIYEGRSSSRAFLSNHSGQAHTTSK
jgi:hypothetical protein